MKGYSIKALTLMTIFLTGLFGLVCCQDSGKPAPPVQHEEDRLDKASVDSLEAAGIDADLIERMVRSIEDHTYPNIHSVLIARDGNFVFERYFRGEDQYWGTPLGVVLHTKRTLHDVRSISKSVVSACIGIALADGLITSVDQNVFEFFPEFQQYKTGLRAGLTLRHLLTMTPGMEWNENLSYDNPLNSEIQMINSPDPVGFVLSRPMEYAPGEHWKYNGGTTQVLASIIQKVSGMEVDEYARKNLFEPLGIDQFEWVAYPDTTIPAAASGLRLRSYGLLKIGLLYAAGGQWQGKQVLEETWIGESFEDHATRPNGGKYGYQFWILSENLAGQERRIISAIGNGDQRIFIDEENEIVVVVTAGNYNTGEVNNSVALLRDYIYPAIF